MSRPAQVKSIDALQEMSAALECFHHDTASAADELDMEIRRASQWISDDCRQYWKVEVRRATEKVVEAKLALEHAEMFRRGDGQQNACIEERKAWEKAKRRLMIAEQKVEAVKRWSAVIEREVNEYRAIRSQFSNWLETDFPKAVALLSRMIAALEAYVTMAAPSEHVPMAPALKKEASNSDDTETPERGNEEDQ
jgi:hypothetical protein